MQQNYGELSELRWEVDNGSKIFSGSKKNSTEEQLKFSDKMESCDGEIFPQFSLKRKLCQEN